MTPLLLAILFSPLLGSVLNGLFALRDARRGTVSTATVTAIALLASTASAAGTAWLAYTLWHTHQATIVTGPLASWMSLGAFTVNFGFTIDTLSLTLMGLITGIGTLIHLYSVTYMKGDAGYGRYFSFLNLFLFFMLLLVMSDNLVTLFIGWEGVGLCSYLLVGFWYTEEQNADAGKKAFIVNRIGDLGIVIALFMLYAAIAPALSGGDSPFAISTVRHFAVLLPHPALICLCLFIAAAGKSAQIPLYIWLPDAMAGPTPVSALIHAATMVTAGVYLIARLFFLFALAPQILELIAVIGVATAFMAATIALVQTDIKRVLAYSTVSQLGYMVMALGVGAPGAAVFHLTTHAFFKACLFLGAGSVIHALEGEQDIRRMGGLARHMPWTAATFAVATLAIAGIPPLAGFWSKDEILWHTWQHGHPILYTLAFATAGLTAFYMFRLLVRVFFGTPSTDLYHPHESPWAMRLPLVLLAIGALGSGFLYLPILPTAITEVRLMMISAAWSIMASGAAIFIYRQHPQWPELLINRARPLYTFLSNKYYVDELYRAIVIKPLGWLSRTVLGRHVEEDIIDGLLVGTGPRLIADGARLASALQSGHVTTLAFYFLCGLIMIIAFFVKGNG